MATEDEEALKPGARFGSDEDPHELGHELGSGAASRVYICTKLRTGEQLAAKVINLQRLRLLGDFESQMEKLEREVQILRVLRHPRIVNLHGVYRTKKWIFLVMELIKGGELFDQIVQNRHFTEIEAKHVFRQLLEGVGYMHSKRVIHRDLKPENVLIVSTRQAESPVPGKLRDVKITDFGLSKIISDSNSSAKTFVGTPQYWAPEVLNVQHDGGSYTQAADFWSLGAVLFVMLAGRYPFDGKKAPLEEQIRSAAFNLSTSAWQRVSEDAKDLVRGLLKVNPAERLGHEECLCHPWVVGGVAESGSIATPLTVPQSLSPSPPPPVSIAWEAEVEASVSAGPAAVLQSAASNDTTASVDRNRSTSQEAASQEAVPAKREHIPSIQVGAGISSSEHMGFMQGSPCDTLESDNIFCLNELLKLQVSIAGSLEMAYLVFRHTDPELSEAIQNTFRQARDLSTHAANIVSNYGGVAQMVQQNILPDLQLSVEEKEPNLAVSLLGMVKGWVANMKTDGEEIQRRYMGLQESVHTLIQRAQIAKMDGDRRMAEAVQMAESDVSSLLSPRTEQQFLALGHGSNSPEDAQTTSGVKSTPPISPERDVNMAGRSGSPNALNLLTKRLFEQLSLAQVQSVQSDTEKGQADLPLIGALTSGITQGTDMEDEMAWKRDVLELLFMAPGMAPSNLPKVEPFKMPTEHVRYAVQAAAQSTAVAASSTPQSGDRETEDAVVRYVPATSAQSSQASAEHMGNSSASLLRALRELKRVDEILHGCSAFWANMDGTVQKLDQMKEHTECLVKFAANSARLRERFEQRLVEYTAFWDSLERLCRQYCLDHHATSKRMYQVIREATDAADIMDTVQSARIGMIMSMGGGANRALVTRR